MKCEDCVYYVKEFNGQECCSHATIEYSDCPEEIPKEKICNDFIFKKEIEDD